ncbi:uncharacterized protein LOC142359601 isoform X2 [Opisthocomus hoazin]|uniref:uncharacterized protein LOC142359601 isoform X2 n=1 Tax=Opisthocomus hoazin TaxID=30419 RepID=UPI003F53DC31
MVEGRAMEKQLQKASEPWSMEWGRASSTDARTPSILSDDVGRPWHWWQWDVTVWSSPPSSLQGKPSREENGCRLSRHPPGLQTGTCLWANAGTEWWPTSPRVQGCGGSPRDQRVGDEGLLFHWEELVTESPLAPVLDAYYQGCGNVAARSPSGRRSEGPSDASYSPSEAQLPTVPDSVASGWWLRCKPWCYTRLGLLLFVISPHPSVAMKPGNVKA